MILAPSITQTFKQGVLDSFTSVCIAGTLSIWGTTMLNVCKFPSKDIRISIFGATAHAAILAFSLSISKNEHFCKKHPYVIGSFWTSYSITLVMLGGRALKEMSTNKFVGFPNLAFNIVWAILISSFCNWFFLTLAEKRTEELEIEKQEKNYLNYKSKIVENSL